jgi:hypothetical protein
MSIKDLVVDFWRDLDDDEAEPTIDAMMMNRGVVKLSPAKAGYEDELNRQRVSEICPPQLDELLRDDDVSSLLSTARLHCGVHATGPQRRNRAALAGDPGARTTSFSY